MKRTMPFGRFKGLHVEEMPTGYLEWLHENVTLYGWLKKAVEAVLAGDPVPDEDDTRSHRIIKPWSPSDGEVVVM